MDAGRAAGSPYSALHPPAGCRARRIAADGGGLLLHRFTRSPLPGWFVFCGPVGLPYKDKEPGRYPAGGPWVPGLSSACEGRGRLMPSRDGGRGGICQALQGDCRRLARMVGAGFR